MIKIFLKNIIKNVIRFIFGDAGISFARNLGPSVRGKYEQYISNPNFIAAVHLQRKLPKNYKIGMAVLIHERPEYLELCLDSLFSTNLYDYDITFLLIDDGSTDPRIKEIIEKQRDNQYKIVRCYSPKGHNSWGAAFNNAMKKLLEIDKFDILGSCDSDALFHPDWLDKTMKICTWAKSHDRVHILGAFSSFNSSDYVFHQIIDTCTTPHGNYVVKKRMGAVNYFLYSKDLKRIGVFAEDKDDETIMTKKLMKLRVRNYSLEQSYVEHIGQVSILNQWRPTPVTKPVYGINMPRNGWPTNIEKADTLGYYRYVKQCVSWNNVIPSTEEIDILIPVVEKDLQTLPFVLSGIRRNLLHPIGRIAIVSPDVNEINNFCKENNYLFIPEETVLPIRKKDIGYICPSGDRSGWLFQQFLKLSVDNIFNKKYVFVIDADTILLKPQVFIVNNKSVLLHSDEHNQPYFDIFAHVFGYSPITPLSFVAHQMLFDTGRLKEMKQEIERLNTKKWYEVIVSSIDKNECSGFSEFETYGQWMLKNHPDEIIREYWFNTSLNTTSPISLTEIQENEAYPFKSLSIHKY